MKNIAIYGGSFNPPTLGHKYVIESIISKSKIEKIILNPDGYRLDKDYKIDQKTREDLVDIFFEELKEQGINIDINKYFFNGENARDTTIMQVKDYYKDQLGFEPSFVFGTDVIPAMPTWKDNKNKYIEKKLKKIFIPRPGTKYDLTGFENYIVLDTPMIDISSTMVKQNLLNNKENINNLLSNNIKEYVIKNNLYI